MPIIKYQLKIADDGKRRILPPQFNGAFAMKVENGEKYYYGYISSDSLASVNDVVKKEMGVTEITLYNDLFDELKPLYLYDENGNLRTDGQIGGIIKGILNRYGVTTDEKGNLVG